MRSTCGTDGAKGEGTQEGGKEGEGGGAPAKTEPPNSADQCSAQRSLLSSGERTVCPSAARREGSGRGAGGSRALQRER
eukprot:11953037-Prorocentrum_lima.AAC.1